MVFLCPCCKSELHLTLVVDYKTITHTFESIDIEFVDEERDESRRGVNIYADLPVRKDKQGVSMMHGGSAFINFQSKITPDDFEKFNTFKDTVHGLYQMTFPFIRRSKALYDIGNTKALARQMKKIKEIKFKCSDYSETIDHYHSLLANFSLSDFRSTIFEGAFKEVYDNIVTNKSKNKKEFDKLFTFYWGKFRYGDFSKRLIDLFVRYLAKFDAIILGAAYLSLRDNSVDLNEYLVFRSDFDELKSIYIDGYEVSVQSLQYILPIYNLSKRGDAEQWSSGERESLVKFAKRTSFKKEFSFSHEPTLDGLYSKMNRDLRNKIGHYDLVYDFENQKIMLGSGDKILLAEFLESFVNVYRVITFLLCFERVMKLEHGK